MFCAGAGSRVAPGLPGRRRRGRAGPGAPCPASSPWYTRAGAFVEPASAAVVPAGLRGCPGGGGRNPWRAILLPAPRPRPETTAAAPAVLWHGAHGEWAERGRPADRADRGGPAERDADAGAGV